MPGNLSQWAIGWFWPAWAALIKVQTRLVRLRRKTPVFLLGTPRHRNLGDTAIMLAELDFINAIDGLVAINVPEIITMLHPEKLREVVRPRDLIAYTGGGNLGDLWPWEEERRVALVDSYRDCPVVIFPQSVYFSVEGEEMLERSKRSYREHPDVTLFTRERASYDLARDAELAPRIDLAPDIVLSYRYRRPQKPRSGVLLCLRNDQEKAVDDGVIERLLDRLPAGMPVTSTDTISDDRWFSYKPRHWLLHDKLREFAAAQLVITDRLHGMIFAALSGTPCLVVSNSYHKVKGTYEWLDALDSVVYCSGDVDTVDLDRLIRASDRYEPAMLADRFEPLRRVLREKAGR